jgi:hypothetical protein
MDLEGAVADADDSTARNLPDAVEEFHTYIGRNRTFIPRWYPDRRLKAALQAAQCPGF